MGSFDSQIQLGRELFELNSSAISKLVEVNMSSIQKSFETQQTFGKKLPEIKGPSDWMELQRDYGETLWAEAQDATKTQGEVVRKTYERAGELLREAFSTSPAATPASSKAGAKPAAA